jgi:methyltransferase (TIGR00027 family)
MGSAVLRAAHAWEDKSPWVLQDTESVKLLTTDEVGAIEDSMAEWPSAVRAGFRLAHAVRARVAEDTVVEGLAAGRTNYVILGAGLDSFSWRSPEASKLRIFEVDHPDTQNWKRGALKRTGLTELPNVSYVSADLAVDRLHDLHLPKLATWNWLGVTMYLEKSATAQVLRHIASMNQGTVLVANFLLALNERGDLGNTVHSEAKKVLDAVGEPVLASYTRNEVELLLATSGFSSFKIFDAAELTERFLEGQPDLVLPSSTIITVATV